MGCIDCRTGMGSTAPPLLPPEGFGMCVWRVGRRRRLPTRIFTINAKAQPVGELYGVLDPVPGPPPPAAAADASNRRLGFEHGENCVFGWRGVTQQNSGREEMQLQRKHMSRGLF